MLTEVSVDILAQIVESVFSTMMDLEVTPGEAPHTRSQDRLTSSVQLTADQWNGAVLLECSKRQACAFAGRILAMEPPDEVDSDVRDMLGELANMIGGNLKSGMAPGVRLSMPIVTEGADYDMTVCGSRIRERAAFESSVGPFWVTVMARENELVAA